MKPHIGKKISELSEYIKSGSGYVPDAYKSGAAEHKHTEFSSVRVVHYKGKTATIQTTYHIEIDGVPLTAHMEVSDDGSVHCHGLPNYSFPSATDMVKTIIDAQGLALVDTNELSSTGQNHHHHHTPTDHE